MYYLHHLTPATYLWRAIRQTENVDENVVRVGMKWSRMQREGRGARGHAGNSTWVRVAGQPRPTETLDKLKKFHEDSKYRRLADNDNEVIQSR